MAYIGRQPTAAALTASDITDGIISEAKMADDAISLTELKAGTDGNIISYDASGNPVAIATGTAGHFLKSAGAGAQPVFAAAGGAMNLLTTETASSDATISFTSGLDSTYKEYVFKFINIHPETDGATLEFQGNAAGGSGYNETITSVTFDAEHSEGDAASFSQGLGRDQANGTAFQNLTMNGISSDSDHGIAGTLRLFNPASTTFVKHFIYIGCSINVGDYLSYEFVSGYFNTTSAIDEIRFKMDSGDIDAGIIKLYGIT